MNYINELVYSNHIAQTKKLVKDKKQKNKYRQTELLAEDQNSDEVSEVQVENINTLHIKIIEEENDRRNGSERRKTQQNRGRYVESRQRKNRRYEKELSLVI